MSKSTETTFAVSYIGRSGIGVMFHNVHAESEAEAKREADKLMLARTMTFRPDDWKVTATANHA